MTNSLEKHSDSASYQSVLEFGDGLCAGGVQDLERRHAQDHHGHVLYFSDTGKNSFDDPEEQRSIKVKDGNALALGTFGSGSSSRYTPA